MEEQKSRHKPLPGIPEALHPEIGNGAALEGNHHDFILRLPDPAIQLADFLNTPNEPGVEITDPVVEDAIEIRITKEETTNLSTPLDDSTISLVEQPSQTQETTETDFVTPAKKSAKKKKGDKAGDKPVDDPTAEEIPSETNGKRQKVGKLLKKATKSIRKKEETRQESESEVHADPGKDLSPFTSWLKKLTGSDYVHPYEDDFAFEQASGQAKEGISETFADLLAAQGYKDQAREMYLKLMEKYPEKSGFFAAKIEAL